jgi:hypothetical protein
LSPAQAKAESERLEITMPAFALKLFPSGIASYARIAFLRAHSLLCVVQAKPI